MQKAYAKALSLPPNDAKPELWYRAAAAYWAYGDTMGAIKLITQMVLDFAAVPMLKNAMLSAALLWRRVGRYEHAATYMLHVLVQGVPPPFTEGDLFLELARTYEMHAVALEDAEDERMGKPRGSREPRLSSARRSSPSKRLDIATIGGGRSRSPQKRAAGAGVGPVSAAPLFPAETDEETELAAMEAVGGAGGAAGLQGLLGIAADGTPARRPPRISTASDAKLKADKPKSEPTVEFLMSTAEEARTAAYRHYKLGAAAWDVVMQTDSPNKGRRSSLIELLSNAGSRARGGVQALIPPEDAGATWQRRLSIVSLLKAADVETDTTDVAEPADGEERLSPRSVLKGVPEHLLKVEREGVVLVCSECGEIRPLACFTRLQIKRKRNRICVDCEAVRAREADERRAMFREEYEQRIGIAASREERHQLRIKRATMIQLRQPDWAASPRICFERAERLCNAGEDICAAPFFGEGFALLDRHRRLLASRRRVRDARREQRRRSAARYAAVPDVTELHQVDGNESDEDDVEGWFEDVSVEREEELAISGGASALRAGDFHLAGVLMERYLKLRPPADAPADYALSYLAAIGRASSTAMDLITAHAVKVRDVWLRAMLMKWVSRRRRESQLKDMRRVVGVRKTKVDTYDQARDAAREAYKKRTRERKNELERMRQAAAAVVLQARARVWLARRRVERRRVLFNGKVVVLTRSFRRLGTRKWASRRRRRAQQLKDAERARLRATVRRAMVKVQAFLRMVAARCDTLRRFAAVALVQRVFRGYRGRLRAWEARMQHQFTIHLLAVNGFEIASATAPVSLRIAVSEYATGVQIQPRARPERPRHRVGKKRSPKRRPVGIKPGCATRRQDRRGGGASGTSPRRDGVLSGVASPMRPPAPPGAVTPSTSHLVPSTQSEAPEFAEGHLEYQPDESLSPLRREADRRAYQNAVEAAKDFVAAWHAAAEEKKREDAAQTAAAQARRLLSQTEGGGGVEADSSMLPFGFTDSPSIPREAVQDSAEKQSGGLSLEDFIRHSEASRASSQLASSKSRSRRSGNRNSRKKSRMRDGRDPGGSSSVSLPKLSGTAGASLEPRRSRRRRSPALSSSVEPLPGLLSVRRSASQKNASRTKSKVAKRRRARARSAAAGAGAAATGLLRDPSPIRIGTASAASSATIDPAGSPQLSDTLALFETSKHSSAVLRERLGLPDPAEAAVAVELDGIGGDGWATDSDYESTHGCNGCSLCSRVHSSRSRREAEEAAAAAAAEAKAKEDAEPVDVLPSIWETRMDEAVGGYRELSRNVRQYRGHKRREEEDYQRAARAYAEKYAAAARDADAELEARKLAADVAAAYDRGVPFKSDESWKGLFSNVPTGAALWKEETDAREVEVPDEDLGDSFAVSDGDSAELEVSTESEASEVSTGGQPIGGSV